MHTIRIKIIGFIAVLFAAVLPVCADVAPDPGYTRVSSNLVLESDADLSAYRFFLESHIDVEEVTVASGAQTKIDAAGRGGAARIAKLVAIPRPEVGNVTAEEIENGIKQKRFPGAIVLLSHDFQATIPEWEKGGWTDTLYRIEISNGELSAKHIAGGRPSGTRLTYSFWQAVLPVAAAGVLLAVGIAIAGLWLRRRRRLKVV